MKEQLLHSKNTFILSVDRRELFRNNIAEKITQLLY